MKREFLFLIFLLFIRSNLAIKIGFIADEASPKDHQTEMKDSFINFTSILNSEQIIDGEFEPVIVGFDVNNSSHDFASIWTNLLEQEVVAVFSFCNFMNVNNTKNYDIIGDNNTILFCGCHDVTSLCLRNVVFYSSIKALTYRYAEYILFHKMIKKMLILKDESTYSNYFYSYFTEVLDLYSFKNYENITLDLSSTDTMKDTINNNLSDGDTVVNLVESSNIFDKMKESFLLVDKEVDMYHTPLMHEFPKNLNIGTKITHYQLLPYITTEPLDTIELNKYAPTVREHHLYQFIVMMEVYKKVLNRVKSVDYLSILSGLMNQQYETFNNETAIRIRNDFHGDVNYFIAKYKKDGSDTVAEIDYTLLYNWFDVYYKYGRPNPEPVGCDSNYGIFNRSSYTDVTVVMIYGDWKYSEKDSNDNLMALMLFWSEVSYLMATDQLMNVEIIIADKQVNKLIDAYKDTRALNLVIMMLKNTVKEKILNVIHTYNKDIFVFDFGFEEGEKCYKNVVMTGISANQYADQLVDYFRTNKETEVFIIMSSTSVSVTAGEVLTTIFESHSIKIVGKYTVLANGDNGKLKSSLEESARDGITIINLAEGEYLKTIIDGVDEPKYKVISLMTSEYEQNELDGTIPDTYYFMGMTYNNKTNSRTNDFIHELFKQKLGREAIVNSKMVTMYAIITLWLRAASYGGVDNFTQYQKFLYNYPLILDDDLVYVLNSNNYGGSQLSIIHYNNQTLHYPGTWIADALAYTNNSYSCDFSFDENLGMESIQLQDYYHIGVLYDFSYDYEQLSDLDYVIQIFNRQTINNKKILLHYGNVKHDDPSSYVKAVKSFVQLYPKTSLCFIGTSSVEQRQAISKTLVEVDKLLFVPSTIYNSECYKNIMMLGPGLFQRLSFALISMLRMTEHVVIIGDNKNNQSATSAVFLQSYTQRFEAPCCVDELETDIMWYSTGISMFNTFANYTRIYTSLHQQILTDAVFLLVLSPSQTEEVLGVLRTIFVNRKTHRLVAFDIDEKKLSESKNKEVYDEVYVPGMYFSERINEQNLMLQSFIKTFYGDVSVMLSTTSVMLYETFLVIKKSVELTNSISGEAQRIGIYNRPVDTPEGEIILYTSNHVDHHIVIGVVHYNNDTGKYDIHIEFQYQFAIFPMVYLPLLTSFYSCDWSTFSSVGTTLSNYLNIYFIGDYKSKYEETGSLAILMQGVVNSINLKGGMLGKELIFSFLGCPSSFEYIADKAVHLAETHTVVIFSNCKASTIDFMARAFAPTSMMMITFGFNPGNVCKQLVLSAYPSPYQILIPTLLELVSKGYVKYYLVSSKTSEYNVYLPIAKNILKDFSQDIFDIYVFEDEATSTNDEIKTVVYNICNGLLATGGLVISFLTQPMHHKLLEKFKIFESGTGHELPIQFVSYSYRDVDRIDRSVDVGNYVVINYIPYLDTPENVAFKNDVQGAFPEKEFHYIDALAHSLLTTWVNVLSKLTEMDFNAVLPLIYTSSLRTPIGLVSIDASNHIHQSVFLVLVGEERKDDKITELTSGLQGNPYFDRINEETRRICDWTTYYTDDYEPPVCHIGISSSFNKLDIYDSVQVLRGTIGAMEFINSHDSVNTLGCYLLPYLLHESDLEEYKKELKTFGEMTINQGRIKGSVILGGFTENCLDEEVLELYKEYHLIYFYIKRTVGEKCNKDIIYMSESLHNNFAFSRTFSNMSSNVIILYDPSERSTEAFNVLYPELIRYGYSVIVRKISDVVTNMNSVAEFIKSTVNDAIIVNLITHEGSRMIFEVFVGKGLIPPNFIIYTYFSKTEKFEYASRFKSPFYSYIWSYPCDTKSKEYEYLYQLFASIKYNDEYVMLSFATMQIYYYELTGNKNLKDICDFADYIYNKEFKTIIGSTIINSNNMLRKPLSLFKFQDGILSLAFNNTYQPTYPTVYSLFEDPIRVCDWKSEIAENGTYERESIHIAVILNRKDDKIESNWFNGIDIAVQLYNQENDDKAIVYDIYEYNDDYEYINTILDYIYGNNTVENNNKTKAIFACREEKCLNAIKEKVNSNNILLFTTAKEEGQKCNKMIISLGLLPNQYLETVMNYIISTDTVAKAIYYFGLDDSYSKTLFNLTEGIYKGIIDIKGSQFVSDEYNTIDNSLLLHAVDLLSENGGYIVCSLSGVLFSNLVKVSKRYIGYKNIFIISLNNDNTEIESFSSDISDYSNVIMVDSYLPRIKSYYEDVVKHYASFEKVDGTFARSFESILFFENAYFTLDKMMRNKYSNSNEENNNSNYVITADELRNQLYNTNIQGFVEHISLSTNNHVVRGVYIGKYNDKGEVETLLPFNSRIIPAAYNKLYEKSYSYYCNFLIQDDKLDDKVYAVLFLLSLTGIESEYYIGAVTVIEEFFAQINADNSLGYTLTYMLEDTKSDDNTCINLVNEYKNKVIAIFGTPTIGCIQNMKIDDGKAIFISFSRELGEICSFKYFSATFDFAQYDSAIAQLLYLDPPAVGIIAYAAESQYIERQLKKFLVTPLFNAVIVNGQYNRDELFANGIMPAGSLIIYAGPSSIVLGLDQLSYLVKDIKIVILSSYRIPVQNLNTPFYAISPYFPEIDNAENKDFVERIRNRLSDEMYVTPEMEYLYTSLHMFYNALIETKEKVENTKDLIMSLESIVYKSPEGTISYENNHRLKHFAYRAKSKGNKEPVFIIEDKSALTPGEVYSLSNSDTLYRTCYFQNGEKVELSQPVKSFGIIISDYKEEKVLLYNLVYATVKIDQEHGLLGNYINVVSKQCNDSTLDICWMYIDEMRKSDDIIFTFTGMKENAILYYNAKMDEENAEEFMIDFPKFSQNFCTHHSYHYFVTPSELARGISLLALQIGKEFLIVYSETTESKEVAQLTEGILNRYNTNLRGKISPRTLSSLMNSLKKSSEGLVLISALDHQDSITFLNRMGDAGITAKKIPIIHAFLDGDDILKIKPQYIPNNYIVTSFHEAIADSNNYESNEKTETSNMFEVPTQAKPFVEGIKGFIGNNPITPIQEATYTAVRSMAKLYELAYTNSTLKLRSLLIKYLYNAPSGETYITETSFLARRIWTIRYNDQNQPKIVPNIMTTVEPQVFDYYANETLGMECTINTEVSDSDKTKYNTKVVKHETKQVLFYHELTSEDGISETTRALIESEIVKTINEEHSFGDYLMIPKYEFGNISNYNMVKAAKQYIYDDNILAAFGCATPECREKIGSVYDEEHKLFYYTGYNEGDSCNAYILNFGNLPNEKVQIALTMASRNDISVYMILGRNDTSTFIRSNQTKKFIDDSEATLVAECYFNLAENKEDIKKVSDCIKKAIEDNPNSGRIGALVYYYGQDFIELVNGMKQFPFKKDALLYILFHYDETILTKQDVMSLSGSYIIATYEPSIESMNNDVFKNTIKNYLFNDVYISEELENTYEAMQVWKSITLTGKKKNDGVVPNDDFLRIVSQEIISSSPACDLSLTSSNYVTKCIYVLQIEENADKTQIYPVSGEQDVVTPEPYLDKSVEKEICVFGKIKKYYDSKSFASVFCLIMFIGVQILIFGVGFILKYFNWTRVVRCSSPPFMYATLAGLLLLSITGYLFSFSPLDYHWVCAERVWMLSLSVDIIFSIMFSKAWRIHKLFNNMQLKRINLSNSQLFRFVLFVVIIQCGYNGLWWGLDPSVYTESRTNTYSTYYEDVYIPQCSESYAFVIIQLVVVFAAFMFGVNLAWKVRKASKEYNESLSLAITILVVLFLGIIFVPLNYVMIGEPNTLMVLRSGGCQLAVVCVLILQFGIKIYAISKEAAVGSTYIDSFTSKGSMSKKQGRKSKRSQYESMRNSRLSSVRSVRPFFLSTYKFSTPQAIAVAVLPYLKYTDPELNGADPTAGGQTPIVGPRGSTANLGSVNQPAGARTSTANLNDTNKSNNSNNNMPLQRPPPRLSVGIQMNQNNNNNNNTSNPMQALARKSVNDLNGTNNNRSGNNSDQKTSPAQPSDNKNMTRISLAERRPVN